MKHLHNPYLHILLSAAFLTISELSLKRGASETANVESRWSWLGINGLFSGWVWFGMLLMVLSFLSWLYALKRLPLSVAYPLSNIVHVTIPVSAWIFLGESITKTRWTGIALVVVGLVIVAKPASQIEEKL